MYTKYIFSFLNLLLFLAVHLNHMTRFDQWARSEPEAKVLTAFFFLVDFLSPSKCSQHIFQKMEEGDELKLKNPKQEIK